MVLRAGYLGWWLGQSFSFGLCIELEPTFCQTLSLVASFRGYLLRFVPFSLPLYRRVPGRYGNSHIVQVGSV